MKYCNQCGIELNDEETFCVNCGARVDAVNDEIRTRTPRLAERPIENKKLSIFYNIALILLVGTAIYDLYYLFYLTGRYYTTGNLDMYLETFAYWQEIIFLSFILVAAILALIADHKPNFGMSLATLIIYVIYATWAFIVKMMSFVYMIKYDRYESISIIIYMFEIAILLIVTIALLMKLIFDKKEENRKRSRR